MEQLKNKTLDIKNDDDIIISGSEKMEKFSRLGFIYNEPIEKEFGSLKTYETIITDERNRHIQLRHPEDYALFKKYAAETVEHPDEILVDEKNENTVFMIKKVESTNLNVVTKVVLEKEKTDHKNSVMTFYRIRDKNLKKLEKKMKTIYTNE